MGRTVRKSVAFDVICTQLAENLDVLAQDAAPGTEISEQLSEHATVVASKNVKNGIHKNRKYVLERYKQKWAKTVQAAKKKIDKETEDLEEMSEELNRSEDRKLFNSMILRNALIRSKRTAQAADAIEKAIADLRDIGNDLQ